MQMMTTGMKVAARPIDEPLKKLVSNSEFASVECSANVALRQRGVNFWRL